MILLSLVLVLASAGLLIAGLGTGDHHLIWGSMAASLLAAATLAIAVFRRRPPVSAAGPADVGSEPARASVATPAHTDPNTAGAAVPNYASTGDSAVSEQDGGSAAESVAEPQTSAAARPAPPADEPEEEQASSTDVLRILDLLDEVLVVDQRPRYHLAGCSHLIGRETVPLTIAQAREAGFSPCALCHPDSTIAARARGESA